MALKGQKQNFFMRRRLFGGETNLLSNWKLQWRLEKKMAQEASFGFSPLTPSVLRLSDHRPYIMLKELIKPEILELIALRQWNELRLALEEWSAPEIAELLLDVEKSDRVILFRAISRGQQAEVFSYLEADQQDDFLVELTDAESRYLLANLSPDDRTALLEELPSELLQKMMGLLSHDDLKEARLLLGYPEYSVGRLMTPDFLSIRADWTVHQTLQHIRQHGQNSETINTIYVVDASGRLIDEVNLRTLILSEENQIVDDIRDGHIVSLSAFDEQESAVRVMEKHDLSSLPVVDSQGVLVGIVTFDDVMDISEEEATEDFQKFGGMQALEDSYRATSIWEMLSKRAGWLSILFVSEMATTSALAFFEDSIAKAAVLVLFIPLVMSSGGNSGSQAATLIIRALALEEIRLRDWLFVMRRELFSGLILGAILGLIGFVRIEAWHMVNPSVFGPHHLLIAFTISFSLVGIVTWGTLTGSMLPFALKKVGFDPATSSAPFVATLVDVVGIVIYFSIAILLLKGTVL